MDKKYSLLFNAITDLISKLESMREDLIALQQKTEEMYISDESNLFCLSCTPQCHKNVADAAFFLK